MLTIRDDQGTTFPTDAPERADGEIVPSTPMRSELGSDPVGFFYAWWRGDPHPNLPCLPGLAIHPTDDHRTMAGLTGTTEDGVKERMERHHQAWLARIAGEPVACGWSSSGEATIRELGVTLVIPSGDRYLWDFMTLPSWRGRGIYPRLLQSISAHEAAVERFWIGHDFANIASARGIAKAGFGIVGAVYRPVDGKMTLVPSGTMERARAAAALLTIPLSDRRDDRRR